MRLSPKQMDELLSPAFQRYHWAGSPVPFLLAHRHREGSLHGASFPPQSRQGSKCKWLA